MPVLGMYKEKKELFEKQHKYFLFSPTLTSFIFYLL